MAVLAIVQVVGARAAQAPVASPPRTPDGRPDLSGFWQVMNTANFDIQDHSAQAGVPAGQGVVEGNDLPYQPAALARKKQNYDSRATADPETKCLAPGVPRLMYMPYPFQIVQSSSKVFMQFEYAFHNRTIFTDGSSHPKGGLGLWLGDSRGRWEGDTLVVETTNFADHANGLSMALPSSSQKKLVERFTLTPDHKGLSYSGVVEDPVYLTKPVEWTGTWQYRPNMPHSNEKCNVGVARKFLEDLK
jgi:hypothetical protein